jgi:hypothetical protein
MNYEGEVTFTRKVIIIIMAQNEYIPLELYRLIVETISDRDTLLSLLLASRHLSTEAERILYHNIEWDDWDVVSQTLFFQTVIDCPRVARLVWRYHFFSNLLIVDDDPYWTLFPAALRALVNLKELEFRNYGQAPTAHVLRGCTFQLVSLYWDCCNEENELSVFLAGQEVLERLCVDYWRGKCAGPPASALQNLSFLAGTSGTIQAFLPGRTITRLRWHPYFGDQVPDVASISSALRNLHVLALDGRIAHSSLSTIVDYLPNLRFLELLGLRETDLLYIHRLPHLEGLVIYMMSIPSCQDLVMRLYSETKSLLFIDIYVNSSDIPVGYQRWCRDSTEPIQVTSTRWNGAWEDNLGDFSSHFDSGLLLAG